MRLFHYTCIDHGLKGIHRDGAIRPVKHPMFEFDPVIWLTDYAHLSDRGSMGLTSTSGNFSCDRTAVCFAVDTEAEPWPLFADRMNVDPVLRAQLETTGLPDHWFVRSEPIPAGQWRQVSRSGLWTPNHRN